MAALPPLDSHKMFKDIFMCVNYYAKTLLEMLTSQQSGLKQHKELTPKFSPNGNRGRHFLRKISGTRFI